MSVDIEKEAIPYLVIIGIGVVAFILVCIAISKLSASQRKLTATRKQALNDMKQKGVLLHTMFTHVHGLPIAENVMCNFYSYADRYEFNASGATFNLERAKITDISIKTETEIQKQYVSSAGGAVGGAILFGAVGAIIGGRAKQKKTKTVNQYMIITYTKDNELNYIGFDVTNNYWKASTVVNEFKSSGIKNNVSVDL